MILAGLLGWICCVSDCRAENRRRRLDFCYYYKDGILLEQRRYHEGWLLEDRGEGMAGVYPSYDAQGRLLGEDPYRQGRREGLVKRYHDNAVLAYGCECSAERCQIKERYDRDGNAVSLTYRRSVLSQLDELYNRENVFVNPLPRRPEDE